MHDIFSEKALDDLRYPESSATSDCLNFVRSDVRDSEGFHKTVDLFIRTCHIVKISVPSKRFTAFLLALKYALS